MIVVNSLKKEARKKQLTAAEWEKRANGEKATTPQRDPIARRETNGWRLALGVMRKDGKEFWLFACRRLVEKAEWSFIDRILDEVGVKKAEANGTLTGKLINADPDGDHRWEWHA